MAAQAASDNTSYFARAGLSRKQGLIKLSNLETQKKCQQNCWHFSSRNKLEML
jgi:hypothetical protein